MKKTVFLIMIIVGISLSFTVNAQNLGITIGDKAPNIIETGINGETYKLSDLAGKLVLIDFWASWCGPCRRENPTIVGAYQKYKNKDFKNGRGFTIFSVSLDQNKARWESAIQQDKLEWPYHVSDLKGWYSKHAGIYKVNSIPSNFLVDENGVIVAKNLRGPMLAKALEQLLK